MKKLIILSGLIILFSSCVPSLYPLYTDKDLIFEPSLLGRWDLKNKEAGITWSFHKSKDRKYKLIIDYIENDSTSQFEVHLVKIGKYLFLDLYPIKSEKNRGFYNSHFIPVHTFSKIMLDKDILTIEMLNPAVMERMIIDKKINISHERLDKEIILTASTKELQRFVLRYAEDKTLFSCKFEFHRQTTKNESGQ